MKINVFSQCKFMPYTGDCHMVSCSRDGQVRLAELSSAGVCKSTKKLTQHKGAAHKVHAAENTVYIYQCLRRVYSVMTGCGSDEYDCLFVD